MEYRGLVTAMDTSAEAARLQRAVLRGKTGEQRVAMALEMSELVRQIAIDGIRHRSPGIDADSLLVQLLEELHGPALARAVIRAGVAPVAGEH